MSATRFADLAETLPETAVVDAETHVGPLWLDASDQLVTPALAAGDVWEPEVGLVLSGLLRPGMTFVDVGANVGYFSVLASLFVGADGHIVAVEPEPSSVRLLRANLWRHRCLNATVLPVAALDRTGHVHLVSSAQGRSSSWIVEEGGGILVPAARLDDLLAGRRVDVVKVDTEGADHLAIRGMEHALAANPEVVVIVEFWPQLPHLHGGDTPAEVLAYYESLGFRLFLLEHGDMRRVRARDVLESRPERGYMNLGLARDVAPRG